MKQQERNEAFEKDSLTDMHCIEGIKVEKRSSWNWYGVKVLYQFVITDEPVLIDEHYRGDRTIDEESIQLVKAQSFAQSFQTAERIAKKDQMTYKN